MVNLVVTCQLGNGLRHVITEFTKMELIHVALQFLILMRVRALNLNFLLHIPNFLGSLKIRLLEPVQELYHCLL
jgi:hypothetical protein